MENKFAATAMRRIARPNRSSISYGMFGAMPTLVVGMKELRVNALHAHDERGHGTPKASEVRII
jgi:hypothetical protein